MFKKDYPYMYARISAKKAKLLDSQDYENLLKMQPNEIARKLEEGDYKEDINQLGSRYQGPTLVEKALRRNLSRSMSKLIEISPEELEKVISSFLRRYDILSLKRLLRWKKGGGDGIEGLLIAVGRYSEDELMDLSEKSFEEICEEIRFPDSEMDYSSWIDDAENLKEIERNLDRAYYAEMEQISEQIGSLWFKKFMEQEAEFENAKIALRLKRNGLGIEEMRKWSVNSEVSGLIEEVMEAKDMDEAIKVLKDEGMIESLENGKNIEEVEHGLEVARLNRAVKSLHLEPLGATSILGYVIAKMVEIKNLRMLIRAKETGIQNLETIRSNLVVS